MKLTLNPESFIRHYWQKKPLFLKRGYENFSDPIAPDEIAGLALEDFISSRIILTKDNTWESLSGPFENYDAYGEKNWQLLVQAVNHWVPECQDLVNDFHFLPDWRIDDLMVSFATAGGGVGAHVDQYDVFIIQGKGSRRWKVGEPAQYKLCDKHTSMAIIEGFEPTLDVEMHAGDILYIPAGFPHCGTTLTNAVSYSLGLRAPSQKELLSHFSDCVNDQDLGSDRFISDDETTNSGIIASAHKKSMQSMMQSLIQNDDLCHKVLGELLSQSRFELDIEPLESPISEKDLITIAKKEGFLHRIGGLKIICHEKDSIARIFIHGEEHQLEQKAQELCYLLANLKVYPASVLEECFNFDSVRTLLLQLINDGYLLVDIPEEN